MLHRSFGDYTVAAIPDIPPGEYSCWILKKGCQTARYCFSAQGAADLALRLSDRATMDVCIARFASNSEGMDSINQVARQIILLRHWKELYSKAFQISVIVIAALIGLFAPGLLCSAILTVVGSIPTFWMLFDMRLFIALAVTLLLLLVSSVTALCMLFAARDKLSHLSADLAGQWAKWTLHRRNQRWPAHHSTRQ